jgi:membrane protein YdbS with pleckstrin-like domain
VSEPAARLRAPAHLVSPRAKLYWTVRALVGWLVVGAALFGVCQLTSTRTTIVLVAVAVVLAGTHLVVMPRWRFRVHRWETTDTAVYTQSGWLNQERRIAPIARIQTVDTERGVFERMFGLSNLTVTTASAAGPLKIRGLESGVANSVAGELTVRAQLAGGDGT